MHLAICKRKPCDKCPIILQLPTQLVSPPKSIYTYSLSTVLLRDT